MNRFKKFIVASICLIIGMSFTSVRSVAYAKEDTKDTVIKEKYYYDIAENAGDDDGYYPTSPIEPDDVHYNWKIGRFMVSGYTRVIENPSEPLVFLKNVGDEVELSFVLEQDINALNGDNKLIINNDKGYDSYFGIEKTKFGHGALIITKRDYQNNHSDPTTYMDYLAGVSQGAETSVQLCEEGDYEVALDYSLLHKTFGDLWIIPTSKLFAFEDDYQIKFKFNVRNGNCMVYPMDAATHNELKNAAFTPNGFYLDLAKSKYLDIDIKKEILNVGQDGLISDTRFNRPAKDGETFTDEGVYTITVRNNYTNRETEKKIYVGNNDILIAYVSNPELTIPEIISMVNSGAIIQEDGSIKKPETIITVETVAEKTESLNEESTDTTTINENSFALENTEQHSEKKTHGSILIVLVIGAIVVTAAASSVITVLIMKKRRKTGSSR